MNPLTDREKARLADLRSRKPEMMSPWLKKEHAALEARE